MSLRQVFIDRGSIYIRSILKNPVHELKFHTETPKDRGESLSKWFWSHNRLSMGGNVHRILLKNEPIIYKTPTKIHATRVSKSGIPPICLCCRLGRWYFRTTLPILRPLNTRIGIKHCK